MSAQITSRARGGATARGLMLGTAALALMTAPTLADGSAFAGWYVDGSWIATPEKEKTATNVGDFGGGRIMDSMLARFGKDVVGGGYHSGILTSTLDPITFDDGRGALFAYGQLNAVVIDVDNGNPASDNTYFATNAAGRSHLGLGGQYDFSKALAVGVRAAFAFDFNRTDLNSDGADEVGCDERDPDDRTFCVWDANFYIQHRELGTITVGYGETAFYGIGSTNLGGTASVVNENPTGLIGGHLVVGLGTDWSSIAPSSDVGRAVAARYDSPTFAGFTLSGSWGEADHVDAHSDANHYWDAALRYAGEFSGFRVAAGVGYQEYDRDGVDRQQQVAAVSTSVLHVSSGLYLSGSYKGYNRESLAALIAGESDNADAYYVQGGWGQNWFGVGKTTLYGEYGATDSGADAGDFYTEDSETRSWGVGVVQNIDEAATALYIGYRNGEAELLGVEGEDIDVIMGGARIKF